MSKPDKPISYRPISEASPADPVKLPVNWMNVFFISCALGVVAFFLGVVTRWRSLLIIADFIIGFAIVVALCLGFIALVKLFSTHKK